MTLIDSACLKCSRFRGGENEACDAYPDGIPIEVLFDSDGHTKPLEGDHGLLISPVTKQKNMTIQDDIADMFNDENKDDTFKRTKGKIDKALPIKPD